MKVEKIYVANNGDIILKYDQGSLLKKVDPAEFAIAMAKAANMLREGDTEFVTTKINKINGTAHTGYYDFSDKLIGISEVTIPCEYEEDHDMFFLNHLETDPLFN